MPRIGVGIGVGYGRGATAAIPPPVIVGVGTLVYSGLGAIDAGLGSATVAAPAGAAWSLTVNGQAAASGTGTGGSQAVTFAVTAAMVGTGVTVELTAPSGTDSTTADVTAGWAMGDLAPTIWCLATHGLTLTDATVPATLTSWTATGCGVVLYSGATYTVTATAGGTTHAIAVGATGAGSGPAEIVMRVSAATNLRWVYLSHGTASAWFDLTGGVVGSSSGSGYLAHTIAALGGGAFELTLQSTTLSGTPSFGFAAADGGTSFSAAGNESVRAEAVPAFDLGGSSIIIQRIVAAWADCRANGNTWAQDSASLRPYWWTDAGGPCVVFAGANWLQADAIASGQAGTNIPFWWAFAIDHMAGTASRCVASFGSATAARVAQLSIPNDASTIAACYRQNDSGTAKAVPTIAGTPLASGVFLDDFTGSQRYLRAGASSANADASVAGDFTAARLTLGASRASTIGSATRFTGWIREVAVGVNDTLAAGERTSVISNRTTRYGY